MAWGRRNTLIAKKTLLSTHKVPLIDWLILWQSGELGQLRIHIVPRLSTGCLDVRLGPKPARFIEATGHDAHDVRRRGRLTGNLNRTSWDQNRRGKCAAGRPLAIATVAIPHSNWIGAAFVTDGPANATAGKTCRHERIPFQRLLF